MAVTVTMPQLGETVTEGTILRWAKRPGEHVDEDEILLEISTDKVDTEVPSPAAGILREILVPEGETVAVGTPLAIIAEPGEATVEVPVAAVGGATEAEVPPSGMEPAAPAAAVAQPPSATPAAAGPVPTSEAPRRGILSPVVRRLAAEHGVDLAQVTGTGEGGRITRRDVERYLELRAAPAPAPPAAAEAPAPPPTTKVTLEPAIPAAPPVEVPTAAPPTPPAEMPAPPVPPAEAPAAMAPPAEAPAPAPLPTEAPEAAPAEEIEVVVPTAPGDQVVDIPRLRRRIAENMVRAKRSTAHVWTSVEVDYERVEQVRRRHRESFKEQEGFSLTYLPFIARATMDALAAHPEVNSTLHLDEGKWVFHRAVHLGIAVDLDRKGLVVVTIRDADGLTLRGLARRIRELADRARRGELRPDDLSGSSFSITNPGPFGSFMSAPIINVPNSAILSTDTVEKRPKVVTLEDGTDSIAIRHVGYLGLTWDHRVFDGSTAVGFLRRIKDNLESWDWDQELS